MRQKFRNKSPVCFSVVAEHCKMEWSRRHALMLTDSKTLSCTAAVENRTSSCVQLLSDGRTLSCAAAVGGQNTVVCSCCRRTEHYGLQVISEVRPPSLSVLRRLCRSAPYHRRVSWLSSADGVLDTLWPFVTSLVHAYYSGGACAVSSS